MDDHPDGLPERRHLLSLSVKATLEGDNLIFADENGLEIGTLQPNS